MTHYSRAHYLKAVTIEETYTFNCALYGKAIALYLIADCNQKT